MGLVWYNIRRMKIVDIRERAQYYGLAFPKYPPLVATDRWLYGIWMIGNDYAGRMSYYGEYPHSYLRRIYSLFPDAQGILHLFSGSVSIEHEAEITFDINSELKPDVVGDAHRLSSYFEPNYFDLILADPPYTAEDAEHYGTPMVNRNTVVRECYKVLVSGGYLVWLDQVLPMYRKDTVILEGTIGLVRSTNHRFRVVSIFRKL